MHKTLALADERQPDVVAQLQARATAGWFVYDHWWTVDLGPDDLLALSPRLPTTVAWCYRIQPKREQLMVIGGGDGLEPLILAADQYASQHSHGEWWSRAAQARLDRYAISGAQRRLISILSRKLAGERGLAGSAATTLSRELRRYASHSRAVASGMIGHLQAQQVLRRHGRWTDAMAEQPQQFALAALVATLNTLPVGAGLAPSLGDPTPLRSPAFPLVLTTQAHELGQFCDSLRERGGLGLVSGPAGIGITTLLRVEAARRAEQAVYCNLAEDRSAPAVLHALIDAVVGGSAAVRHRRLDQRQLEQLLDDALAQRPCWLLLLDHVTALPANLLACLAMLATRRRCAIILGHAQAQAGRLERQLRAAGLLPLPSHQVAALRRRDIQEIVLPALLATTHMPGDSDELPWASDELWRAAGGSPDEDVRWSALLPMLEALQRQLAAGECLTQELVRRTAQRGSTMPPR